jgi:serine O-acetyltransferase
VRAIADTDARAALEGDPSAVNFDEVVFSYPGFAAVLRHRLAHRLHTLELPLLARIIAEDARARTGIDIHPGAQIGERFFIDHGAGVVIGPTAVIGRNVHLYQAVTLGAKSFDIDAASATSESAEPRDPIIEDDVVIYAGATILGRIVIGKGSSIGGNVWLTQNVRPVSRISQAKARYDSSFHGEAL